MAANEVDSYLETTFAGRYEIERELGRGGVGIVYLAKDKQLLSRRVVVKVLFEKSYQDEWVNRKFTQEMEALSRIDHPNVVSVLDAGTTPDGRPFLVMQFIEGSGLNALLGSEKIEFPRISSWIRQIGQALAVAHDKGILHRDLKPENIMIQQTTGEERVKLIDFGLAKVMNSQVGASTAIGVVAGTFGYMSPEQLTAKPVTAATDVYALGAIAYEMVSGRKPFPCDSVYELYEKQKSGVTHLPHEFREDLPAGAETAILKALSFDPEKRYQTAREFCDSFTAALSDGISTPMQSQNPIGQAAETQIVESTSRNLYPFWGKLFAATSVFLVLAWIREFFFRFDSWASFLKQPVILIPVMLFLILVVFYLRPGNSWFDRIFFAGTPFRRAALSILLIPAILSAILMTRIPPALTVSTLPGKLANSGSYTLNYSDTKGYKYTFVDSAHCAVTIDPGGFNRLSDYKIRIMLSPEIEFADVYFDKEFQIPGEVGLEQSNTNDVIQVQKSDDTNFNQPRTILFSFKYRAHRRNNSVKITLSSRDTETSVEQQILLP